MFWQKGLTHCGASAFYFCVTLYFSSAITPPQITSVWERYCNLEIIEECDFSVFIFSLWDSTPSPENKSNRDKLSALFFNLQILGNTVCWLT